MKKQKQKQRSFRRFTQEDWGRMEVFLDQGHTQKYVAEIIGKSESAVSRDLLEQSTHPSSRNNCNILITSSNIRIYEKESAETFV